MWPSDCSASPSRVTSASSATSRRPTAGSSAPPTPRPPPCAAPSPRPAAVPQLSQRGRSGRGKCGAPAWPLCPCCTRALPPTTGLSGPLCPGSAAGEPLGEAHSPRSCSSKDLRPRGVAGNGEVGAPPRLCCGCCCCWPAGAVAAEAGRDGEAGPALSRKELVCRRDRLGAEPRAAGRARGGPGEGAAAETRFCSWGSAESCGGGTGRRGLVRLVRCVVPRHDAIALHGMAYQH